MPWIPSTTVPSLHGPAGSVGGEDQHAAAHRVGDDDVEGAVAVPDGGCPGAAVGRDVRRRQLAGPLHDVADQVPVDQVPAVEDRDTRQVLECRGGEVVVVADLDHARVRVEARRSAGSGRPLRRSSTVTVRRQRQLADRGAGVHGELARLVVPAVVRPVARTPGRVPRSAAVAVSPGGRRDRREADQPADRAVDGAVRPRGVHLHDLLAGPVAGVGATIDARQSPPSGHSRRSADDRPAPRWCSRARARTRRRARCRPCSQAR